MAKLGLVTVEDGILESCRKMMAFWTVRNKFHIPRGYGYIWESILALPRLVFPIPMLLVADPWKDWSFGIGQSIFVVNTNDVYHKLVEDRAWLATKVVNHGTLLDMQSGGVEFWMQDGNLIFRFVLRCFFCV